MLNDILNYIITNPLHIFIICFMGSMTAQLNNLAGGFIVGVIMVSLGYFFAEPIIKYLFGMHYEGIVQTAATYFLAYVLTNVIIGCLMNAKLDAAEDEK